MAFGVKATEALGPKRRFTMAGSVSDVGFEWRSSGVFDRGVGAAEVPESTFTAAAAATAERLLRASSPSSPSSSSSPAKESLPRAALGRFFFFFAGWEVDVLHLAG